MVPFPNVLAGILIGIANESWVAVVVVGLVMWPIVFCTYVSIADRPRVDFSIAAFRERARRLLFNSPVLTFYAIEFFTASLTAFPIAVITFGVKHLAT